VRYLLGILVCLLLAACNKAEYLAASFESGSGAKLHDVQLEVVKTSLNRAKGLMYRRELPVGRGMLFVFPKEEVRTFWMKNTYISLDIIFLNKKLEVLGLVENVPILNETPRGIDAASMYVVELPAGTAKRFGISAGSVLRLPSLPVATE
jgi:uncharacterized protein